MNFQLNHLKQFMFGEIILTVVDPFSMGLSTIDYLVAFCTKSKLLETM